MWDERYSTDDYLFGTEPAEFLTRHRDLYTDGMSALAVADGEGRNAVYLAQHGLDVTSMDLSPVGVAKAEALAAERGVAVAMHVADVLDWDWEPNRYDLVVAVFIQFLSPPQRQVVVDGMQQTLRPGGRLLLHGYRPEQLDYGTGGPPIAENLYTEEMLADAFGAMEIEHLSAYDAEIVEGTGHVGMSALIDLVARKPG
jgi:SAM-dependent methyltransferase